MVEVMVLFAALSLLGGGMYALSLWQNPLTAGAGQIALVSALVAAFFWIALAVLLGNQRRILADLKALREAAGADAPTPEPNAAGAGSAPAGSRALRGE